jgi:hypothetical protein
MDSDAMTEKEYIEHLMLALNVPLHIVIYFPAVREYVTMPVVCGEQLWLWTRFSEGLWGAN